MSKNNRITVAVEGIRYGEFSKLKWRQFLRYYTIIIILILAAFIFALVQSKGTAVIAPTTMIVVAVVLLGMLLLAWSTIKSEYRKAKLQKLCVTYTFDKSGWAAENPLGKASLKWKDTWRVRQDGKSLLLYPNPKSVNMVPIRCLKSGQLEQIISWSTGKNK